MRAHFLLVPILCCGLVLPTVTLVGIGQAQATCVPADQAERLRTPASVDGVDADNPTFAKLDMQPYITSDSAAANDMKAAIRGLSAFHRKHHHYPACDTAATCQRKLGINLTGGVAIRVTTIGEGYIIVTRHKKGLGTFIHNSWQPDETRYCRSLGTEATAGE